MTKNTKIKLVIIAMLNLVLTVCILCSCNFVLNNGLEKITVSYDSTHKIYDGDSLESLKPFLTVIYTNEKGNPSVIEDYNINGNLTVGACSIKVEYKDLSSTLAFNVEKNLEFNINNDKESYSLVKVYNKQSPSVEVPSIYNGKPVTQIDFFAFDECAALKNLIIGSNIMELSPNMFRHSHNIEEIKISEDNPYYYSSSDCIIRKSDKTLVLGCNNSLIPNDVVFIGERAFWGSNIKYVVIPNSVISIGEAAFESCDNLESVVIGNKVAEIQQDAFAYCKRLESINISNSVKKLGELAFGECVSLKTVIIGSGISSIDPIFFRGSSNIQSLTVSTGNSRYYTANNCIIERETGELVLGCKSSIIPTDGSVVSIGHDSFYGCVGLTSIAIPSSIKQINWQAFYNCKNLSVIVYYGTVSSWNSISKFAGWNEGVLTKKVGCSNGEVSLP